MKKINIIIIIIVVVIGVFLVWSLVNNKGGGAPTPSLTPSATPTPSGAPTPISTLDIQGMKVEILKEGAGEAVKSGDRVTVDYVGTFENGTKFDSSIDRGEPLWFDLGLNRVIQGWELGIPGMKVGEKRRLTIPSELAYGDNGRPPIIPPKATLIFEVELLKIGQ